MNLTVILVFIVIYILFSISGFIWRIDKGWYKQLKKPILTPPNILFAIIWPFLYLLIDLSVTVIYSDQDFSSQSKWFYIALFFNYIFNQAFSFIQFKKKDLYLSFIDTVLISVTTLLLIILALPLNNFSAILLIPYFVWSCFATYLSFSLYKLNK